EEEARQKKIREEAERKRKLIESASFSEDMGLVFDSETKKYGYIDRNGKLVIYFTFQNARNFTNGYAVVKNHNKWGMIDKSGKKIIDFKYDLLSEFDDNGFAWYEMPNTDSKRVEYPYAFGILDRAGNLVKSFINT